VTTTDGDNGESAPFGNPMGTVTMTVGGDIVFEGNIVECTLVEPDVAFTSQGETSKLEVSSRGGGNVDVVGTGAYEFDGEATVSFDTDTVGFNTGDATITATATQPDNSTPEIDFTIEASITSC
jgi:2',3'-cyclic-nucleotide 2'-phosphodiesterase (5'-nucleotidase family)